MPFRRYGNGGEQGRRGLGDHPPELDWEGGVQTGPALSEQPDSVLDRLTLARVEPDEGLFAGVDQPPHGIDLLLGGECLAASPVGQFWDRRSQSFTAGEQRGEVGTKLGQVGRIGPEMAAAKAAVTEVASGTVSPDVGGLHAAPHGHRDLGE